MVQSSIQRTSTNIKKQQFLESFKQLRYITDACNAIDIDRGTYYKWMENDPDFVAEKAKADQYILEHYIEREIDRRGIDGIDRELTYQGRKTGDTIKEYSDNLLMFRAKALAPDKYRDNPKVDVSGTIAHTYNITVQGSEADRGELENTIQGIRLLAEGEGE